MTKRTLLLLILTLLCSLHLKGCRSKPAPQLLWEITEDNYLDDSELEAGGKRVALVASCRTTVRDAYSGETLGTPVYWVGARAPRFLEGNRLALIGGLLLKVYDIESGKVLSEIELPGLVGELEARAGLLATTVRGEGVHCFSSDSLEKLWEVTCLASEIDVSPRGKLVAVSCRDQVLVLDGKTGREVHRLPTPGAAVKFCPRGEFLAVHTIAKGGQFCLKIFHTTSWREMGHKYKTVTPLQLSWSASGASFLTGFERNLKHWAVGQPRLFMAKKVDSNITTLALSSTEDYAFYATRSGARALVDARDGMTVHTFEKRRASKATFGPGGKHIFLELQDEGSTYQVWDLYGADKKADPEEELVFWARTVRSP